MHATKLTTLMVLMIPITFTIENFYCKAAIVRHVNLQCNVACIDIL